MIPEKIRHLSFCKVLKGSKKSFELGWSKKPYTYEEIKEWVAKGNNYGIISGYNNLVTLDCDCAQFVLIAEKHLPPTFTIQSSSIVKRHFLFYMTDFPKHIDKVVFIDPDYPDDIKKEGGDIRYKGFQSVGPGSIHPETTNPYIVHDDLPIAELSFSTIHNVFGECFRTSIIPPPVSNKLNNLNYSFSIIDVINKSGIVLKSQQRGDEYFGSHPVHGSKGGTNFSVNIRNNLWHCFRCGAGGDTLFLIAVLEGIIDCSEALPGALKGDKFIKVIEIAKNKYGIIVPDNSYTPKFNSVDDGIITLIHRDTDSMIFKKNNYEFLFTNIGLYKAGKLKSILTLSRDNNLIHKTELNLSIHSHREHFIKAADDNTLNQTLVELEGLVRKQLKKEEEELILKSKQPYIMTDKEKDQTIKFMEQTHNILYKIIEDTNKMGIVGEETLRLMVYLCFTSRILKEPLSMTVKGESSSGKSFSCQSVMKLIPEEGYQFITRATQNAFFHLPEDGMQHKIIYINELQGSETADYSIRSAQSEGDLIIMMPIKDPNTGEIETVTKKVKGPVGFLITTTKANMFDENETRNFSVFSDDSPELTKDIGDITVRRAQGETFELDNKDIDLWKNMQRLLKADLKVVIPYAKEVLGSFPDRPVRIRRDRERFRVLINVITILHQAHRKIEGKKIYSTLADYYIAKAIAEDILIKTIYESSTTADTLLFTIKQMKDEWDNQGGIVESFTFTYKSVAEKLGWTVNKVKKWAYSLIRNGMIEYIDGGEGGKFKKSVLQLTKKTEMVENRFLPEINDLLKRYPCPQNYFYDPLGRKVNLEN